MIKIDKETRNSLEKHGCKFGNDLHRTYGKHKTYYATTSPKVMKLIEEFQNSKKAE